ncbi:uncharacterized protein SEPMUDRAFT_135532 [Sphaerulina musiva SO2202]|uniref:G-patch domain-containing protein n=1 Tax=Sphaerulina musiva (strain SO2202) TaxID=692275 RepID=M3AVT6_SPHMS|nr:uncharacterized protein SEPMUDRAFT_135532 [Sphaerulina musiva SO2202]EMF10191.1 hypothetical protein SEPMUDRAFT_135532 [Sphaerulina musiva SO2202]
MGLAGNKKKGKLSTDPNNTAWAKSTTSFGHKMLSKQGWKPGDFLGAENASHASHYTAANASHIKVMLREENLGIGAKIGTQNAETFGLSMFSGLLGRLNGKEEDRAVMQKKEETLRDVQLKLKYGNMNFVSGGMLVGDKMQEVKTDLGHLKDGGVVAVQESKKRKAGSDGSEEDEKSAKKRRKAEEKEKKKKKEKKANGTAAAIKEMKRQRKLEAGSDTPPTSKESPEQEADSSSTTSSSSEDEQESKRGKKAQRKTSKSPKRSSSSSSDVKDDEKARLKEEKRARKEERRKRKEEKRAKRAAKALKSSSTIITKTTTTQPGSTTESETQSGTSTPTFLGGRQAVRHRYIMQKRMAGASAQALQEIFMMKPQVAS